MVTWKESINFDAFEKVYLISIKIGPDMQIYQRLY
jgi:hypothetical protein